MSKVKTINLLLYEGDLDGVISIEDTSWNSGELYAAPRDSIKQLIESDACKGYGVYILFSQDKVYVGQASDLTKRISQHTIGKDWWTNVIVLTTKDDSFNRADIDYLEYYLIEKAQSIKEIECDNKKKGNDPKVSKFRVVALQQYLEEALFLMKLIGVSVFDENAGKIKKKIVKKQGQLINTMDKKSLLRAGKRVKAEAKEYVLESGIDLCKDISYAVKQTNKDVFWINPKVELLEKDWSLILNNNTDMELIVLKVPANTFNAGLTKDGNLVIRKDKPQYLDVNINANTFVDITSGVDFSKYIVNRISYR
ncbi:MAG: GIY-YIG nuclease family protein [Clostridia bacterium]|nr:GIY-YIG nuclease family protein [Clostridia bacterium]